MNTDYWPHDTTLWVKDFKGNNPKFVYYFFNNMADELKKMDVGAANPALNRNHVHPLPIIWTRRTVQNQIAQILGSLDDKIELNRQMNATLEAMAQALFKSWFVDFDPVIDNALAAGHSIPESLHARAEARKALGDKRKPQPEAIQKQFPNRFVFTEEMGWVPEGWEYSSVKEFVEVTDYVANGSFAALKENVTLFDEPNYALYVRTTDFKNDYRPDKAKYVDKWSYDFLSKSELSSSDVIISNVGDTGTVFRPPSWLGLPMTLGSNAITLKTNNMGNFLERYFLSYFGQHQISGIVGGSAQPKFNKTDFRSLIVHFGSRSLVSEFEGSVQMLRDKQEANRAQTMKLAKLRDTLLPKLLSGQLRIPDAGKLIEEASA